MAEDGTVTGIRPFIHDPAADYEYFGSFTPDGRSVLFASQTGCVFQAWLAPVDDPTAAVAVGEPAGPSVGLRDAGERPVVRDHPVDEPGRDARDTITRNAS